MTGPSKRDVENRLNELEDNDDGAVYTLRINDTVVATEWSDENAERAGEVVDEETTVLQIGGEPDE